MDPKSYALAVYIVQAASNLLIAGLLYRFLREHRRKYLQHWSASWFALSVFHAGTGSAIFFSSIPATAPLRLCMSSVTLCAGLLQLTWLLIGTLEVARTGPVSNRLVKRIVFGCAIVALALTFGTAALDRSPRLSIRVSVRSASAALAFAAAAILLVRSRALMKKPGPRLLAAALVVYGIKHAHDAWVVFLPSMPGYLYYLALFDVVIQLALGAAMVVWMVDEEQTTRIKAWDSLRQTEENLRQSQKMEAVGQLAGGVAHDFNNLITSILGYSDLIRKQLPEDAPSQRDLLAVRKAARRAASLTKQLLAFGRRQVMNTRVIDLNEIVRDTESLISPLMGAEIDVTLDLDSNLSQVYADAGQIEQVLVNLAINARDAMTGSGKLSFRTCNLRIDESNARDHAALTAGPYVLVEIGDTGDGIDPKLQGRIFEPFFTTKAPGEGSGLGLSMVYGIVKQSGGNVILKSEPNVGTTFRIYLPATSRPRSRRDSEISSYEYLSSSEGEVLLVEDDALILPLLTRSLKAAGYKVRTAISGEEALRFLDKEACSPDLLVTDMVMPGMGGIELAKHVKNRCPQTEVLFISGFPKKSESSAIEPPPGNFLQKPFSPAQFVAEVSRVLAEAKSQEVPGTSQEPA